MWIAARWSHTVVSPGASWASSWPRRSIQTLRGPLIMILETSASLEQGLKARKERCAKDLPGAKRAG